MLFVPSGFGGRIRHGTENLILSIVYKVPRLEDDRNVGEDGDEKNIARKDH